MKRDSHFTPEQRLNISMGTKRALSNPIIQERKSQAAKLAWQDPEKRMKFIEGRRKRYSNPEERKKTSRLSKAAWDTPEIRAKHMRTRTSEEYRNKFLGENNPMWIDGRSFDPYCYKFTEELKEKVRQAYNYKCGNCGKDQKGNVTKTGRVFKLAVHHVDEDKMQGCDKPWDLVPLCLKCHAEKSPSFKDHNLIDRRGY
jgi:hypothetical protein